MKEYLWWLLYAIFILFFMPICAYFLSVNLCVYVLFYMVDGFRFGSLFYFDERLPILHCLLI